METKIFSTPHISAREDAFAKTVLMPGDPLRAKFIADNYLEDARCVTSVRNMLDRFYGPVPAGSMSGKTLYFLFQGAAPEDWMLRAGEYTMSRFAQMYGFRWGGMAVTESDARSLSV